MKVLELEIILKLIESKFFVAFKADPGLTPVEYQMQLSLARI